MSTLTEVESAVQNLSLPERQKLLLFLAENLRAESSQLPEPRLYSSEEVQAWIAEDEEDMHKLRGNP